MKILLIFLNILFVTVSSHTLTKRDLFDEYGDQSGNELPRYPVPAFSSYGDIEFFPRIVGGTRARLGEFPAKVSVQLRRGFHICGGALLDPTHILTAAHCVTTEAGRVFDPDSIKIMGDDLSIDRWGSASRQIRFVSHIFVFPLYNSLTFEHDIAVLRVSIPFVLTETFRAMPRAFFSPQTGESCQLAGWGALDEHTEAAPIHLMRVDLDIIDSAVCNRSYGGVIPPNHFCAGHMKGGRDACFGDSGGGLICNRQIAGVVSFGYGCGRRNFPGAYVDVSRYNRFISDSIVSTVTHDQISTPPVRDSAVRIQYWLTAVLITNILFLLR